MRISSTIHATPRTRRVTINGNSLPWNFILIQYHQISKITLGSYVGSFVASNVCLSYIDKPFRPTLNVLSSNPLSTDVEVLLNRWGLLFFSELYVGRDIYDAGQ